MRMLRYLLVMFVASLCIEETHSFVPQRSTLSRNIDLSAVRQPRRNLKKRRGRERKSPSNEPQGIINNGSDVWETSESRPLIFSRQKESGLDFWIDPDDLEKEKQRQQAIKNRKSMEGEMSKERLMTEVTAPYKQNWIGIISVVVVVLAVIVTNFPEMLENPRISFPDLVAGDPIPMQSTLKSASSVKVETGEVFDQ